LNSEVIKLLVSAILV